MKILAVSKNIEFLKIVTRRISIMILPLVLPGYKNRGLNMDPQKRKPCTLQ